LCSTAETEMYNNISSEEPKEVPMFTAQC
jgi:hypothetical protein